MIGPEEAGRLHDQLLAALEEDAHNTTRLLTRLDTLSREAGVGAHAALLLILSRLAFEDDQAREHWERILAHRDAMAAALGRDVGVRVALFDYFINLNRRIVHPRIIDLRIFESGELLGTADGLTGLATARAFASALRTETSRARRHGQHVAVALFDLDDFAAVNERVGEAVADRLLHEAAVLLVGKVRDIDVAARPGEDELALVLPHTDRNGALVVAERLRGEVEAHFSRRLVAGRAVGLTVSGGVAACPEDAGAPEVLLERAAQALYRAKASGRNAVAAYQPERRRFLRFELEPGRFEVEVLSQSGGGRARPGNLSRSGIVFASPEALMVGEEIELRLVEGERAGEGALRVRGRVVRLEEIPDEDRGAAPASADVYEIGVALDLQGLDGERAVLGFLERALSGPRGKA